MSLSSLNVGQAVSAAQAYGVPPQLFMSLLSTESALNPNAVGPALPSGQQPIGAAQVLPSTAAGMGFNAYDPAQNLQAGADYLAQQYKTFGNWTQALEAYNAGPANVQAGNVPTSSQQYAATILQNAGMSTTPSPTSATAAGSSWMNNATPLQWPTSAWQTLSMNLDAAKQKMATQPAGAATGVVNSITGWISSTAGNYGLAIMGALLVLGALLVSQKDTVVTLAKGAAS